MGEAWQALGRIFSQPIDAARHYDLGKLRGDVVAGITVAVVAVPQSMAYAIIAGVHPRYGLYTLIIQSLIGSLFNSNRFLSVGPINTQSLLVAATVTRVMKEFGGLGPAEHEAMYLQLVIALTLLKGVIQLGLAAARLGALVRYVSQSVLVGFMAGAGVLIAAGQINNFLGFEVTRTAADWPGLIGVGQRLAPHLGQTSVMSVGLGVLGLVIVIGLRRISPLAPGPLIAVGVCALIVAGAGWTSAELPLVPDLPRSLPAIQIPHVVPGHIESLISGALALALLGLMEAYTIGKSIAARTGQRISANQELFSQGLTNFASSFFQCIPGSGSFSRSALNHYAGARTLYSGVFNALFVAVILVVFAPYARFVPMTALAVILFVIAWGLIDWRYIRRVLGAGRADAAVCFATFASTLVLPLQYAIYVGILLNMALYVHRSTQLHLAEMLPTTSGAFAERPMHSRQGGAAVRFLQLEGDLFFGVADELQDRLNELAASGAQIVILRLKRIHLVDATVLSVLDRFIRTMQERGGHVIVCGLRDEQRQPMQAFGLIELIGAKNVFDARAGVFTSAEMALNRARELAGGSMDIVCHPDDSRLDMFGSDYEI